MEKREIRYVFHGQIDSAHMRCRAHCALIEFTMGNREASRARELQMESEKTRAHRWGGGMVDERVGDGDEKKIEEKLLNHRYSFMSSIQLTVKQLSRGCIRCNKLYDTMLPVSLIESLTRKGKRIKMMHSGIRRKNQGNRDSLLESLRQKKNLFSYKRQPK